MGMFDYVNVEVTCPKCKSKVDGFQSKDGECLLKTIDPEHVFNFYTSCESCGVWIEYNRPYDDKTNKKRSAPFNKSEIKEMGFILEND